MYRVCLLRTRTPKLSGATLIGVVAWLNILHSAFHFQKLLFQFFLPISHLIGCSQSAVYCSHLTPCKSSSWRFWEIVRHSQKKLKRIQEIVKKVYHDKALMRTHINNFQRAKEAKPLVAAANQQSLNAKASIIDITAEVENDWWESIRKLAQAHDILI